MSGILFFLFIFSLPALGFFVFRWLFDCFFKPSNYENESSTFVDKSVNYYDQRQVHYKGEDITDRIK